MKNYGFTKISSKTLKMSDSAWENVPMAELDWFGFSPSKGYPSTNVKGVYSDEGLTLLYRTNERPSDVLARFHGKNEQVCLDSCVEFFFKPLPEKDDRYMNIELSAGGGMLIGLGEARKGRIRPEFELSDFEIETEILEDGWRAKFFVPFSYVKSHFGDFSNNFKGNFYKCGDETACVHYGTWNPVEVPRPDYHRPEFFGELYLK